MKKLLIPTLLATALLTQAACGNMAGGVAQELVSSYLVDRTIYGRNVVMGTSWPNHDKDIRETQSTEVPGDLLNYVKDGGYLRVDTDTGSIVRFTPEEFQALRTKNGIIDPATSNYKDNLILMSLNLKKEHNYKEVIRIAKRDKSIIVLKGLLNDSISETVTEAKRFTDEGITVLIAPQLVKLFRGYAVPTFVQANVLPDGKYGCDKNPEVKCKTYFGTVGLNHKPLFSFGAKPQE
jgi:hypothetical protein